MVGNLPANNLTFCNNLYTPYIHTVYSKMECTHSFLKASIRKLICNHQVDWDETVHTATMAYNVFPNSLSGESLFYLMLGVTISCQLYLNYCYQNLDTWVMKSVKYT